MAEEVLGEGRFGGAMNVYNEDRTFVSAVERDHPRYAHLEALIRREGAAGGNKGYFNAFYGWLFF